MLTLLDYPTGLGWPHITHDQQIQPTQPSFLVCSLHCAPFWSASRASTTLLQNVLMRRSTTSDGGVLPHSNTSAQGSCDGCCAFYCKVEPPMGPTYPVRARFNNVTAFPVATGLQGTRLPLSPGLHRRLPLARDRPTSCYSGEVASPRNLCFDLVKDSGVDGVGILRTGLQAGRGLSGCNPRASLPLPSGCTPASPAASGRCACRRWRPGTGRSPRPRAAGRARRASAPRAEARRRVPARASGPARRLWPPHAARHPTTPALGNGGRPAAGGRACPAPGGAATAGAAGAWQHSTAYVTLQDSYCALPTLHPQPAVSSTSCQAGWTRCDLHLNPQVGSCFHQRDSSFATLAYYV